MHPKDLLQRACPGLHQDVSFFYQAKVSVGSAQSCECFYFQPSIASAFIPFACAIILWQQHCDFRFPDFKDYLESFCFLILQTAPLTGGLENIPLCCGPRSYFKIFYWHSKNYLCELEADIYKKIWCCSIFIQWMLVPWNGFCDCVLLLICLQSVYRCVCGPQGAQNHIMSHLSSSLNTRKVQVTYLHTVVVVVVLMVLTFACPFIL